ncbi:MAG: hypothetical protein ABIV51_09135 [Saprospiraceae bacterium]
MTKALKVDILLMKKFFLSLIFCTLCSSGWSQTMKYRAYAIKSRKIDPDSKELEGYLAWTTIEREKSLVVWKMDQYSILLYQAEIPLRYDILKEFPPEVTELNVTVITLECLDNKSERCKIRVLSPLNSNDTVFEFTYPGGQILLITNSLD